jgi:hypothetical protein
MRILKKSIGLITYAEFVVQIAFERIRIALAHWLAYVNDSRLKSGCAFAT